MNIFICLEKPKEKLTVDNFFGVTILKLQSLFYSFSPAMVKLHTSMLPFG